VVEEKKPLKDIATKLFVSEYQLKLLLKDWGVDLPGKREYRRVPRPRREELMESYNEYKTTAKVAGDYGASVNTVNRWMKELKIPTRRMKKLNDKERVTFLEEHLDELGDVNF